MPLKLGFDWTALKNKELGRGFQVALRNSERCEFTVFQFLRCSVKRKHTLTVQWAVGVWHVNGETEKRKNGSLTTLAV
jgi:hypothetical protein